MPRWTSKKQRVRIAVAKFYGIGDDEWSIPEIADYLGVQERTVKSYINDTAYAQQVEDSLQETASNVREDMVLRLLERQETLDKLEREFAKGVSVMVTGYELETIQSEIKHAHLGKAQFEAAENQEVDVDIPIPNDFKEVPQFERLQKVWEEQRAVSEELRELLGLDEPEEVDINADVTERKLWEGINSSEMPTQEVEDIGSTADE